MHRNQQNIATALDRVFNNRLESIYSKSRAVLHNQSIDDVFLKGQTPETEILENGVRFKVNWVEGQKTGFFLDQRENRKLLGSICQNQTVLNTFCYTGGFSAYALKHGAAEVCSVDVSAKAMELTATNAGLNPADGFHHCVTEDVNTFLKEVKQPYDIVILDPPAYAKSLSKKHQAIMGYKRLNELGMKAVKPGGLLLTFSCSQVINESLFAGAVTAAGIELGRNARILHRLTQGPDHPVNLFHPEGSYLKGLLLRID
jgi:23S rRNA (cytosine1962-C5)-methyltransferase